MAPTNAILYAVGIIMSIIMIPVLIGGIAMKVSEYKDNERERVARQLGEKRRNIFTEFIDAIGRTDSGSTEEERLLAILDKLRPTPEELKRMEYELTYRPRLKQRLLAANEVYLEASVA